MSLGGIFAREESSATAVVVGRGSLMVSALMREGPTETSRMPAKKVMFFILKVFRGVILVYKTDEVTVVRS